MYLASGTDEVFVKKEAELLKLTPYRLPLAAITFLLLGVGFYFSYRRPGVATVPSEDGPACACEFPGASRVGRVMLWVATIAVAGLLSFPYLAGYLFG